MAEEAQSESPEAPDQGDSGLHDLSTFSDEIRPQVESLLKEIEGNTTRKFQQASEYKKQWEPYEELGLNEYQPEQIQQLLEFAKIAGDQDAFAEWWKNAGEELGLSAGDDPEDDADLGELSQQEINAMIERSVAEKLAPIQEKETAREQEARISEAEAEIRDQLDKIKADHPNVDEDMILRLAYTYEDDDDPISKGFEDYQKLLGQGESGLFEQKVNQPKPSESGGAPASTPPIIDSYDKAEEFGRERMRRDRAASA